MIEIKILDNEIKKRVEELAFQAKLSGVLDMTNIIYESDFASGGRSYLVEHESMLIYTLAAMKSGLLQSEDISYYRDDSIMLAYTVVGNEYNVALPEHIHSIPNARMLTLTFQYQKEHKYLDLRLEVDIARGAGGRLKFKRKIDVLMHKKILKLSIIKPSTVIG